MHDSNTTVHRRTQRPVQQLDPVWCLKDAGATPELGAVWVLSTHKQGFRAIFTAQFRVADRSVLCGLAPGFRISGLTHPSLGLAGMIWVYCV